MYNQKHKKNAITNTNYSNNNRRFEVMILGISRPHLGRYTIKRLPRLFSNIFNQPMAFLILS